MKVIQEQTASYDMESIKLELAILKATKVRYTPKAVQLCEDYANEKKSKILTERRRNDIRIRLNEYRNSAFPASEQAINRYLRRFGVGFQLSKLAPKSLRSGNTCTYNAVINESSVAFGKKATLGEPSFRNTLSSGDRNTLALSLFFASLDQDDTLANKTVVIDDPISSLDDHRSHTTVGMIKKLASSTEQVFVLSHDKRFLCEIWNQVNRTNKVPEVTTIEIIRCESGATLRSWHIKHDLLTEHDRRYRRLHDYAANGAGDKSKIAQEIRLHLEHFLRVTYPTVFPHGKMLGYFLNKCLGLVGEPSEILDGTSTGELSELIDYANRFHHDTSYSRSAIEINDAELRTYVNRTLAFTRLGNSRT